MRFSILVFVQLLICELSVAGGCENAFNQLKNNSGAQYLSRLITICEKEANDGDPIAMYAAYTIHSSQYFMPNGEAFERDIERMALRNVKKGMDYHTELLTMGSYKATDIFLRNLNRIARDTKTQKDIDNALKFSRQWSQIDNKGSPINPVALLAYADALAFSSVVESPSYNSNNYKAVKYREQAIRELLKSPNWLVYLSDFIKETIAGIGTAYAFGDYGLPIDYIKAYAYINSVGAHNDYRISLARNLASLLPNKIVYPDGLTVDQKNQAQHFSRELDVKIIEPIRLNDDHFRAIKFEIQLGILSPRNI